MTTTSTASYPNPQYIPSTRMKSSQKPSNLKQTKRTTTTEHQLQPNDVYKLLRKLALRLTDGEDPSIVSEQMESLYTSFSQYLRGMFPDGAKMKVMFMNDEGMLEILCEFQHLFHAIRKTYMTKYLSDVFDLMDSIVKYFDGNIVSSRVLCAYSNSMYADAENSLAVIRGLLSQHLRTKQTVMDSKPILNCLSFFESLVTSLRGLQNKICLQSELWNTVIQPLHFVICTRCDDTTQQAVQQFTQQCTLNIISFSNQQNLLTPLSVENLINPIHCLQTLIDRVRSIDTVCYITGFLQCMLRLPNNPVYIKTLYEFGRQLVTRVYQEVPYKSGIALDDLIEFEHLVVKMKTQAETCKFKMSQKRLWPYETNLNEEKDVVSNMNNEINEDVDEFSASTATTTLTPEHPEPEDPTTTTTIPEDSGSLNRWTVVNMKSIKRHSLWNMINCDRYKNGTNRLRSSVINDFLNKQTLGMKVLSKQDVQNVQMMLLSADDKQFTLQQLRDMSVSLANPRTLCEIKFDENREDEFPKVMKVRRLWNTSLMVERLFVLTLRKEYRSRLERIHENMAVIVDTLKMISHSESFRQIVSTVLMIGNVVAMEHNRRTGRAFQINFLNELGHIKSSNQQTLLEFLIIQLKKRHPRSFKFITEFSWLGKASTASESINDDVDSLIQDVQQMRQIVRSMPVINRHDHFKDNIVPFCDRAKKDMTRIRKARLQMDGGYNAVCEYLSLSTNRYKLKDLLFDLHTFWNQFCVECQRLFPEDNLEGNNKSSKLDQQQRRGDTTTST